MNCRNVGKYLDAYVDGELEPGLMLDTDRHLETCDGCRALVVVKRKLKSGIAALGQITAPDALRSKINRLTKRRSRLPVIVGIAALPLAAAASVLLIFGSPFSSEPEESLSKVVDDVVARHIHELPMEVKSADPRETSSWFRGKVDFPVRAPSIRLKQASLEGARLSNVREHPAAHMTYKVDGHRVTLMIFNRQSTALGGGRRVFVKGKEVLLGKRNGFNVAVLLDGDIAYAFSSDLSQDRLISLIEHTRR